VIGHPVSAHVKVAVKTLAIIAHSCAVLGAVLILEDVTSGGAGQRLIGLAPPQIHNRAIVAVEHVIVLRLHEVASLESVRPQPVREIRSVDIETLALEGVEDSGEIRRDVAESGSVEIR